jgi:hypothetical protein
MGSLMDVIMKEVDAKGPRAVSSITRRLKKIDHVCAWTEGHWRGLDAAWDQLQNTSQDKRRLARYLLSEYERAKRSVGSEHRQAVPSGAAIVANGPARSSAERDTPAARRSRTHDREMSTRKDTEAETRLLAETDRWFAENPVLEEEIPMDEAFVVGSCFEYINKRGRRSSHKILDVSGGRATTDRGQQFKIKTLKWLSERGKVIRK